MRMLRTVVAVVGLGLMLTILGGCISGTDPGVTEKPIAAFTVVYEGCANEKACGQSYTFDALNNSYGDIVAYDWTFDTQVKSYETSGGRVTEEFSPTAFPVNVMLVITDSNGQMDEAQTTVFDQKEKPEAFFSYSPHEDLVVGDTLILRAYASTGDIVEAIWNFGEGTTIGGDWYWMDEEEGIKEVAYTFTTPGTHKITLTVVDECGCIDSHERTFVVGCAE